jgi:hypothetical protein
LLIRIEAVTNDFIFLRFDMEPAGIGKGRPVDFVLVFTIQAA